MKNKTTKGERYPGFRLIKTSHLLDSIWLKEDNSELKIVFATCGILEFRPLLEADRDDFPLTPKRKKK